MTEWLQRLRYMAWHLMHLPTVDPLYSAVFNAGTLTVLIFWLAA